MPRSALVLLAASLLLLVAGCSASGPGSRRTVDDSQGRSVVGAARRSDGTVVLVTAWCLGQRREQPRIAIYDGRAGAELYAATGDSSDPVTVHEVGRPGPGFEVTSNLPLPSQGLMIAHNAGERGGWWQRSPQPSLVAVFALADLPTSDEPLPKLVIAGERQRTSTEALIAQKCPT